MSGSRRDRWVDLALASALAVLVLGPVLFRRGFAMRGDMVLVPHQPWKGAWLALDGSAPRFVPGDAVLSLASAVVPGDLVQKVVLLGALVLAGTGAGRLVSDRGGVGRAAAVVLFLWNPWVLERLSIGQWGSVVGYAALPYVVLAAARARADLRGGWPPLVLWLGFTALWSPASALMGALTAFCVTVTGRRAGPVLVTAGASVIVNLTWLMPSVVSAGRVASPGAQFDAFASRAESGAGLLASVVSLGGIWKASVVPGERTVALVVVLSGASTLLALVAGWRTRSSLTREERLTVRGLSVLAGLAVAVALLPAIPVLADGLDSAARHAPGLGALRDGHRYLGPAVLLLLPGLATATDAVWSSGRRGAEALRAVAVLVVLLPVLCLPSMFWGLGGDLRAVTYPGEWFTAASVVADDVRARGGATVVLPWRGSYRGFGWNDSRAQLDPAPRFFEGEILIDDRIYLGNRPDSPVLANEDPRLKEITAALADPDPAVSLAEHGVARVLLEKANGATSEDVPSGEVLHSGPQLLVVALADPAPRDGLSAPRRTLIVIGDAVAGLACLVAIAFLARRRVYGERPVDSGRGSA